MRRMWLRGAMLVFGASVAGLAMHAETPSPPEWRYWGGDKAFTRYLPLDQITPGDLPEKLTRSAPSTRTLDDGELVTLAENERRYVARVVAAVGGNKSQAARLLGIDRKSLWRRLAREKPDEA